MTKLTIVIKDIRCFCDCFRPPKTKGRHEKEVSSSSSHEVAKADPTDIAIMALREFGQTLAETPSSTNRVVQEVNVSDSDQQTTSKAEKSINKSIEASPSTRIRNAARQLLEKLPQNKSAESNSK